MAEPQDLALAGITKQLRKLMDGSQQAMYIYLDDKRKACNSRMADLLGYPSAEAWASVRTSFPQAFVQEESQDTLVSAYQDAMRHGTGSAIPVVWKRKDGEPVDTDVVLVPIEHEGQRMALHFIEPASDD